MNHREHWKKKAKEWNVKEREWQRRYRERCVMSPNSFLLPDLDKITWHPDEETFANLEAEVYDKEHPEPPEPYDDPTKKPREPYKINSYFLYQHGLGVIPKEWYEQEDRLIQLIQDRKQLTDDEAVTEYCLILYEFNEKRTLKPSGYIKPYYSWTDEELDKAVSERHLLEGKDILWHKQRIRDMWHNDFIAPLRKRVTANLKRRGVSFNEDQWKWVKDKSSGKEDYICERLPEDLPRPLRWKIREGINRAAIGVWLHRDPYRNFRTRRIGQRIDHFTLQIQRRS
jgi:hypothetical protein